MAITYILTAAGEGSRFHGVLPGISKPAIQVHGTPSLIVALRSLPLRSDDHLILITQTKHDVKKQLQSLVSSAYPLTRITWIEIDYLTRGQLETAILADSFVDPNQAIAIFNCDTYFESRELVADMENNKYDALIPCFFETEGDSWSFCRADDQGRAIEVTEKRRISDWCSVGFYFFRDSQRFLSAAKVALAEHNTSEYFVAPLLERYLKDGMYVKMPKVTGFFPLGTPDQIEKYWKISPVELRQNNLKRTLVIDLDNTITIEEHGVPYDQKRPNLAVIEKMREFKNAGYQIVVFTARRMRTFANDESKVVANIAETTTLWLRKHNVPFDGLRFGKPYAENGFYVDDLAFRPNEFLAMSPETQILQNSKPRLLS